MSRRLARWLFIAGSLALAGCASGPAFQPVGAIPPGQALVYVYRPGVMHGAIYSPGVEIGTQASVPLGNGGYFTAFVPPGPLTISIYNIGKLSRTIEARAGATYYFRGGTMMMAGGYPALQEVPADVALTEIKDCKLITGR